TQLWDQDVQMAADAPRWQVTEGLVVACEAAMGRDTLEALSAMGHQVIDDSAPEAAFAFGGAQLVHRLPDGGYAGGSDPRKDGAAVGF
ncbi:MAG: gamma-glutamyltransferase, partial [Rhodobacteraceae bacterium]|nr:gamma-glutamyltransferase [Paracoccaceae bacterium]